MKRATLMAAALLLPAVALADSATSPPVQAGLGVQVDPSTNAVSIPDAVQNVSPNPDGSFLMRMFSGMTKTVVPVAQTPTALQLQSVLDGIYATPTQVASSVTAGLATLGSAAMRPATDFSTPAQVSASIASLASSLGSAAYHPAVDFSTPAQLSAAIAALGSASLHPAADFATPAQITAAINALALGSASTHPASDFSTPAQVSTSIMQAVANLVSASQMTTAISNAIAALGLGSASTHPASDFITPAQLTAAALYLPGGPFTVATLPICNAANSGKLALTTDLGGGPDNAKCRLATNGNYYWQNTDSEPTADSYSGACAGTYNVTPLVSSPIQDFTGCTSVTTGFSINVKITNLYPGEQFRFLLPSSLGVLSSVGINLNNASTGIQMVSGSKTNISVKSNGSTLLQLQ